MIEKFEDFNIVDFEKISNYLFLEINKIVQCSNYNYKVHNTFIIIRIDYYEFLSNSSMTIIHEQVNLLRSLFDRFNVIVDFDKNNNQYSMKLSISRKDYRKVLSHSKLKKFNL